MVTFPKIYLTSPCLAAVICVSVPRDKIQEVMGPALQELYRAIKKQKVGVTGPWFTHHAKMLPDRFELEVCLPIDQEISALGRVRPASFPSIQVVEAIHYGDYEGLGEAWEQFLTQIDKEGYRVREDIYESYLVGPEIEDDPAKWQTRLWKPLRECS